MTAKHRSTARKLAIGEVAARTGLATSALRYYEREGLIPPADRSAGKRFWNADVVERLALIGVAKAAGFTVAEIRTLLSGFSGPTPPGARLRKLAARKLIDLDTRLAEIDRMKRVLEVVTRCDCLTLDECARALGSPSSAP